MEGKSSLSDIMTKQTLSGFQDLLGPMQFHQYPHPHTYQHGSEAQPQTKSVLPVEYMQEQAVSFVDYNENGRGKSLLSDDYVMNCAVTGVDGHIEVDKERGTPWQRSKWTEKMAKLLITAASYIAQYASAETGSGRTESSLLQKMGKWKLISKFMVERGYHVSPQQCEDKFNNVNKGYKRLIDLLGKGTSYKVVQNPKLLDEIHIPQKMREDVKKLLSSKQLFYEEMCSYHNGNQFYLPHNSDLEWSLQLALRKKDDYELHSEWSKADDEQDHDAMADGQENEIDTEDIGGMFVFPKVPATISKKVNDHRVAEASNAKKSVGFNGILETSKADDEQGHDAIADGQENEIDAEDIGGMFVFPKVPATISKKVNDHRVAEASNAKKSVGFNGILETSKADDAQDHDAIADGQVNEIDTEDIGGMFVFPKVPATISEKVNDHRVAEASNAKKSVGFNGILETSPQYGHSDSNPVSSEGDESNELQKQWMAFRSCRLKLQKLQVEAQLHKLEKQRFKWQGKCWKHDRELNKMRLQNERLKIENERMEIEMTYKDLSAHYNLIV
ncbi:hypothetical protein Dsin_032226 [Dipteronia sinensis]|uniref:Myb/SANT-like DNA-binding domain-containing protein n=1 Tax=Dipteronia sinensis TaxID=43782 RepID=A0AAE0DU45_9ROSI|nr:hypothetical protein Dsin_032226 [Dipteronia sinensis]